MSPLVHGLLHRGTEREVVVPGMDHPVVVEAYTVPEAARALGRAELTMKRWLADDLIPEPILVDTLRGYRQYSVGELQSIAQVLVAHEREYTYYSSTHRLTRERIMQQVSAYRAHYI